MRETPSMLHILAVGDIKLDTFIVIHDANVMCEVKMPECKLCIPYGKKIPVDAFVTQIAGSAPNVAIGGAKFGLKTACLSILGEDLAASAKAFLKKNKVKSDYLEVRDNVRSSAAVVLNYKGESTQLVDHVSHKYALPSTIEAEYLHISELGPDYEGVYRDALAYAARGTKISFNPGAVQLKEKKQILTELMSASEILFLNTSEARGFLNRENDNDGIHSLLMELKALGPKFVVITDGAHGAYAYDGKEIAVIPAFPVHMVEATGAGDAFSSGFLSAIIKGKSHKDALKIAAVNAASVVQKVGPTAGLLSLKEITAELKSHTSFQAKNL